MNRRVVVIGSGGHAREVLQILLAVATCGGAALPIGFIDEDVSVHGRMLDGFPVLGSWDWFGEADGEDLSAIVAVGTPLVCERLSARARAQGLPFVQAISPQAWVAPTATIGAGVVVFPGAIVNTQVSLGDHVTLNATVTVSHESTIGSYTIVGPGAHIAGNVSVGPGCFIGMGANVIQGVTIGDRSVIGAGAVVLEDVPADTTVAGIPARVVGPASSSPMAATGEERRRGR